MPEARIGERVRRFEELDSTNEEAFRALERGDGAHGDVYIASRQSGGRGTRGRRWESAVGGLYLSLILGPDTRTPPAGLWTIAGAVAVHDAVTKDLGLRCQLDWPNDVVSTDGSAAKLAGVLAESRSRMLPALPSGAGGAAMEGATQAARATFVLGLGLNVKECALPDTLKGERPVTSLEGLGADASVDEAARAVVARLAARCGEALESPQPIFDAFFAASAQAGRDVRVEVGQEVLVGSFSAFDHVRGVAIETDDGGRRWASPAHIRSMATIE